MLKRLRHFVYVKRVQYTLVEFSASRKKKYFGDVYLYAWKNMKRQLGMLAFTTKGYTYAVGLFKL